MTALVSLLFIAMIPIDNYKFFLTLVDIKLPSLIASSIKPCIYFSVACIRNMHACANSAGFC